MRWHKYIHTHRNTYSIIPKAFLRSPGFCLGGHTFGSPSLGWLGLNRSGHHSSSPPSSLSSGHSGSQGLCRHGLYIANSGISVSNLALWHQPRAETFPHVLSLPAPKSALTLPASSTSRWRLGFSPGFSLRDSLALHNYKPTNPPRSSFSLPIASSSDSTTSPLVSVHPTFPVMPALVLTLQI